MHPLLLTPVATAGRLLLQAIAATYRLRDAPSTVTPIDQLAGPAIFAWWHDQTGTGLPLVLRLRRRIQITVMASKSKDGELAARAARGLGLTIVRGSSTRGGQEGLRALHRAVARRGCSTLVFPDGPQGPKYVVKPGMIVLAQMSGVPIVPVGFAVRAPWHLGSWDRMQLPRPGARIEVQVGPPLHVPREVSETEREALCLMIAATLDACRPDRPGPPDRLGRPESA
jgi:hypothetical protein